MLITLLTAETPLSRILLKKLRVIQLVTKFPAFYATRSFIAVLLKLKYCVLDYAKFFTTCGIDYTFH
jgi:hypothetical protein